MGLHILQLSDEEADVLGTVLADVVEDISDWIDAAEADGDNEITGMRERRDVLKTIREKL